MVNFLAVLVAAIAAFVIGSLWYSPMLFGKLWAKLSKVKKDKKEKMTKSLAIHFVALIVMAYVLDLFLLLTGAAAVSEGIFIGFLIWIGFLATESLGIVLWQKKPFKLYILNNAMSLLSLVVMGAILAAM